MTSQQIDLLKQFRLDRTPRFVGNPRQHIVIKPKQYLLWLKRNNGRSTCYTSHNSYVDFKDRTPKTIKIRNIFLDFDKDEKNGLTFRKVARDVQLVTDFLSEWNIQHTISFSGNSGYHIFLHTKPSIENLENGLNLKYRGLYAFLNKQLNLKSLDQRCAEPKRLCRIPGTKYIKENKITKRKCYPISNDEEIPTNKEEMYERSKKEIKSDDYVRNNETFTINELIDEWSIELHEVPDEELYSFTNYEPPESNFLQLIGEFFRPCIRNALFTSNPPHFIRVSACIKIKRLYPQDKAVKFFDMLSDKCNWIDKTNRNTRVYNIRHIFNRNYKLPQCKRIREEGYCVGKSCRYYNELEENNE